MNRRVFWVLLLLFLGLAAWLRFVERGRPGPEADLPPPYLAIEPTRVKAVTVAYGPDTTRMVREGADWWIVEPIRFPADPIAVEALLERFRTLVPIRAFPRDSATADPYGFAQPLNWIAIDLEAGGALRLDFGRTAPAANAFYLQVSGRDSVALIPQAMADNYFRKDLDAWRDPRLFDIAAGRIVAFELEGGAQRVRVARVDPGAPWRVEEPFPGAAELSIMDDFVRGMTAMKARSFPDVAAGDTMALGLANPSGRITLIAAGGERLALLFGHPIPSGPIPEVSARRVGEPWVYGVPGLYQGLARQSDLSFRNRRPLGGDRRAWRSLTFLADGDSARLQPDSTGAWRFLGEAGIPGSPPPDRTDLVELWAATDVDTILPAPSPAGRLAPTPGAPEPATAGKEAADPAFGLLVRVETVAGGTRLLAIDRQPQAGPWGETWPSRLLFSDLPRPGEVFHLRPDLVRQALALVSGP